MLQEIIKYDPHTGGVSWLITGKGIRRGAPCGTITTQGYHRIKIQQAAANFAYAIAADKMFGEFARSS